ncbi:MAG: hypothetical protein COC20_04765 [Cellvibrionales bacterium]|nr:MAG: hypothetical protein COC20_04765 [Cellvibrionales bacterium]
MNIRRGKPYHPPLFDAGFIPIKFDELDQVFLGSNSSPRRKMLTSALRLFIKKLESLEVKGELWINGSLSTKNPEPMDFDVVLVISRVTLSAIPIDKQTELYELTDLSNREYVRTKWSCDLFVIESSNIGDRRYYEEWFSRNPDELNKKGIPVITL